MTGALLHLILIFSRSSIEIFRTSMYHNLTQLYLSCQTLIKPKGGNYVENRL